MKTTKFVVLLMFLVFFFTGCVDLYMTNYESRYKKYLKYSFGEYEISKESHSSKSDFIPLTTVYSLWTLNYKDADGEAKTFKFTNTYEKQHHKVEDQSKQKSKYQRMDESMCQKVYDYAYDVCCDEIGLNICNEYYKYIPVRERTRDTDYPEVYTFVDTGNYTLDIYKRLSEKCLDEKEGLNFRKITAKEFYDKWEGKYEIQVITPEKYEKIDGVIHKTKLMLIKLAANIGAEYVEASIGSTMNTEYFRYLRYEDYRVTYDKKSKTFNIIDSAKERAERNEREEEEMQKKAYEYEHPDGHIRYVVGCYINGQEGPQTINATYDKETKQYYIEDIYFEPIEMLGIKVNKEYEGDPVYTWSIGNDDIIFDRKHDGSVKINGEEMLTYSSYKKHGLTLKDYERITHSTVTIDEIKETIIITAK